MNIHALSGIRSHDPSSQEALDLCPRLRNHQDFTFLVITIFLGYLSVFASSK